MRMHVRGKAESLVHSRCSLNANTRPSQNLRGLGHFQFLRLLIYFKNEGTLRQGCQNHSHNFKNIQIRKKYLEHIHTNIHPTHPIKIHASNMRENEVGMLQPLGPLWQALLNSFLSHGSHGWHTLRRHRFYSLLFCFFSWLEFMWNISPDIPTFSS